MNRRVHPAPAGAPPHDPLCGMWGTAIIAVTFLLLSRAWAIGRLPHENPVGPELIVVTGLALGVLGSVRRPSRQIKAASAVGLVVTANLAFSEWVQVFGDEKLTTALLDRLGHHAESLTTRGDSYRTGQRRRSRKTP